MGFGLGATAQAMSLADISGQEAGGGLKEALTQGAGKALDGRESGQEAIRRAQVSACSLCRV